MFTLSFGVYNLTTNVLKCLDFNKETVMNVTAYNLVVVSQIIKQFPFSTGQMDGQEGQYCKS